MSTSCCTYLPHTGTSPHTSTDGACQELRSADKATSGTALTMGSRVRLHSLAACCRAYHSCQANIFKDFISFDGETDYAGSPSQSFQDDLASVHSDAPFPLENQTSIIDAGPFGRIDGGIAGVNNTKNYEQYQWLANDLANVDRTKTPWVIAMSHRPMYSSDTAQYQVNMRNAFEELFISHGVDLYVSGHIHWYER